jgi:hypothetical protein
MPQRNPELPAVCLNKKCEDYKAFELVNLEDIKEDDIGGYIYCPSCLERIDIE